MLARMVDLLKPCTFWGEYGRCDRASNLEARQKRIARCYCIDGPGELNSWPETYEALEERGLSVFTAAGRSDCALEDRDLFGAVHTRDLELQPRLVAHAPTSVSGLPSIHL